MNHLYISVGAKGGALTKKGTTILYDFFKFCGYEKQDLENVVSLDYGVA